MAIACCPATAAAGELTINVIVALTEMQLSDAAIIARWRQPASISILIR